MLIRTAKIEDLQQIAEVEAACFPPAEAATEDEFIQRLEYYKEHFWLMFDGDRLIAFVDGMVTDQKDLTDEMYEKASMHDEKGSWQMIFGVNTIPSYRRKGKLIPYYSKFGFELEGVSESVHGNVVWNQMRLTFPG